jgi:tRNA (guanine37-N1)-methyltransferase
MRIDILTVLPGIVEGPLQHSILHRAQSKGHLEVVVHDLRDYSVGKHRQVDDYPYGGGAGMVMKPEPIFDCLDALRREVEAGEAEPWDEVIYLTPDGERLTQPLANTLSLKKRLVLLAGHYKGVDQRVRDGLVDRDVSIGDYVLSGGELPALVLVDAVARLLPGVLGDAESALSDSFQDDLLDAPLYTRPASYRGRDVPPVLLSGDHKAVETWREKKRLAKTERLRPDLLAAAS